MAELWNLVNEDYLFERKSDGPETSGKAATTNTSGEEQEGEGETPLLTQSVTEEADRGKRQKKKKKRRAKKKQASSCDEPNKCLSVPDGTVRGVLVDDVAVATGIDWGPEGPPQRMVELQRRHTQLVFVHNSGGLTLQHIKNHNEFLVNLTEQIADEGEQMKRKFRMATAKQERCRQDAKRTAIHRQHALAIKRKENRYNNEVTMTQFEVDWLHKSPAYASAMKFIEKHWVRTAQGEYVSKQDLNDDMSVSFDELLSQMKLEEASRLPTSGHDGDGICPVSHAHDT